MVVVLKMSISNKASLLLLFSCLLTAGTGCARKQWRAAQQKNTIAAYATFLEKYPNSWYSDSARTKFLEKVAEKEAREAEKKAAAEKEYLALLPEMKEAFKQWRETGDKESYKKLLAIGNRLATIRAEYDSPLFGTDEIANALGPPDEIEKQGDEKTMTWKLAPQEKGIPTDMTFSITVKW
jgi:hypothetical protein